MHLSKWNSHLGCKESGEGAHHEEYKPISRQEVVVLVDAFVEHSARILGTRRAHAQVINEDRIMGLPFPPSDVTPPWKSDTGLWSYSVTFCVFALVAPVALSVSSLFWLLECRFVSHLRTNTFRVEDWDEREI